MKILTYNIMSGCFDGYGDDASLTNRLDVLQKGLKKIDADFVGLVDSFKWKSKFTTDEIKEKFGYKHVFMTNMDDTRDDIPDDIGVTVLTNLDVKDFSPIRCDSRTFINARCRLNDYDIDFYVIYLDDLSEDRRLAQISSLLNSIDNSVQSVILGDFNSYTVSDLGDEYKKRESYLKPKNQDIYKMLDPITDEMKRGEVVELVKSSGLLDSVPDGIYMPSAPSPLFPGDFDIPILRVDYIFRTPGLVSSSPTVYTEGIFKEISDHYPFSVELYL